MRVARADLVGRPVRCVYDGKTDDLLTAGLGASGLRAEPPRFDEGHAPSVAELRRRAIHMAYRGLVDVSEAGGFGRFFGPIGTERVAGTEWHAQLATDEGEATHGMCLQVPAAFDPRAPRLLLVAAAGSRGIYGGLPTAAEWGLRHGYAVIHSDKGAGIGVWDETGGQGFRIDGTLCSDRHDPLLSFAPPASPELLAAAAAAPHTLLFKHSHGGANIEASWGRYLLQALLAGLDLLSEEYRSSIRRRFHPERTLIVAVGVSNGGAAVLRALEADRDGWIDGAVAVEPNAIVAGHTAGLAVAVGPGQVHAAIGHDDYANLHFLLQGAAALAETDGSAPCFATSAAARAPHEDWCRELQAFRVLPPGPIETAAQAARGALLSAGVLPEALRLGYFNVATQLWPSLTLGYAAAYARLKPFEAPFGVRAGATNPDGWPRPLAPQEASLLWTDGAGLAPTAGVDLLVPGGDGRLRRGNDGTVRLAASLCPDRLIEGIDRSALLAGREALLARVRAGYREVVMGGLPGNRPVILLAGRADGLIPVNHGARAYYAVHRREREQRDELRYYELEHAQHFDAMLAAPGFAEQYVPMQAWLNRSLELIERRLAEGLALPPSQVLRTRARGAGRPALAAQHLGVLREQPGTDAIHFADATLTVPP
jgi:hydroxybutyrate-dimer hydrolase